MASALRQGSIVWAEVRDKYGNEPKHRPVAIISPDDDIRELPFVAGVVCSHSAAAQSPLADCWVELPYHRKRNCCTKLAKPTVAIPTWVVKVATTGHSPDNIGGWVPMRLVNEIVTTIVRIKQEGCVPVVSCYDVLCQAKPTE